MTWLSLVLVTLVLFAPGWGLADDLMQQVPFPDNLAWLLLATFGGWVLLTGLLLALASVAEMRIQDHPLSDLLFKTLPRVTMGIARWLAWGYLVVSVVGVGLGFVPSLDVHWELDWQMLAFGLLVLISGRFWGLEQRLRYVAILERNRLARRSVQDRIRVTSIRD